jgi:hypothetical protein
MADSINNSPAFYQPAEIRQPKQPQKHNNSNTLKKMTCEYDKSIEPTHTERKRAGDFVALLSIYFPFFYD